jgi:hypothetical protein
MNGVLLETDRRYLKTLSNRKRYEFRTFYFNLVCRNML